RTSRSTRSPHASHRLFTRVPTHHLLPLFFFFNATPPPEIYTLSLHDALPILVSYLSWFVWRSRHEIVENQCACSGPSWCSAINIDRKSTRLNSSHLVISYAVFCLKKKRRRRCATRSHGVH